MLLNNTKRPLEPQDIKFEIISKLSKKSFQDMIWHQRMCKFAHHPHPNILPAMPQPKTQKAAVAQIVKENLKQEGGATL